MKVNINNYKASLKSLPIPRVPRQKCYVNWRVDYGG